MLSGTSPARNVDAPSGFELRSSAVAISRIFWSHLPTAGNSGSSSPSTVVLCSLLPSVCLSVTTHFAVCTHLSVTIALYLTLLIQNLLETNRQFFSKTLHCEIGIGLCFIYPVVFFKCVYLTTPSVAKIIQRWRQIIEYGSLVEWYCQSKMEARGEKPFLLRTKSHMKWSGIKPEPPRWGQRLPPELWHRSLVHSLTVGFWILTNTFCREPRFWGMRTFVCGRLAVVECCRLFLPTESVSSWRHAGLNWTLPKMFAFLTLWRLTTAIAVAPHR